MKDLGLKRGTVKLVAHKASWHQAYTDESKQMQRALRISSLSI